MTTAQPMDGWNTLPWTRFERQVFKLQKRIYQASQRGDVRTAHRLEKLLMTSRAAKYLAVRRVTQDNQGKRTAGVDGVRALSQPQRLHLARDLRLSRRAQPLRRVWIPKPGSQEKRGLGIPTIRDRAVQALVKLAMEPEWEARFEPNSYGFRPGRSCHDAIEAIFGGIRLKAKYVLDADIAKCFDRINHQALLDKLQTFPTLRRIIRAWLRAGVMDGRELFPTTQGTPQGGVISPLLANVALHGLETTIRAAFPGNSHGRHPWKPIVVRYADDFVILHEDLAVIERAQQVASAWLAGMGLELKPSKTRIGHTLHRHDGQRGFDFLGFVVRQFPVGKTHSGKIADRSGVRLLGFKTIIAPSDKALNTHLREIGEIIRANQAAPQALLIERLNPIIRGWSRYFSTACSKDAFAKADHLIYVKLRSWALKRHHNKTRHWLANKYWHRNEGSWRFAASNGRVLLDHDRTPIRRHTKVQGHKSPFDGDWFYWATRRGHDPALPRRAAALLRSQRGRCNWCGLFFRDEDLPEVDHIRPAWDGGADEWRNWQLLHRHCHDRKTALEQSKAIPGGIDDNDQTVEEPNAAKVARSVCAVRRVIISPVQPGDTRRRCLGYQLTSGRKTNGTGACWEKGATVGRRGTAGCVRPGRHGEGLIA
jgi:RNA-directed DNA polymerase